MWVDLFEPITRYPTDPLPYAFSLHINSDTQSQVVGMKPKITTEIEFPYSLLELGLETKRNWNYRIKYSSYKQELEYRNLHLIWSHSLLFWRGRYKRKCILGKNSLWKGRKLYWISHIVSRGCMASNTRCKINIYRTCQIRADTKSQWSILLLSILSLCYWVNIM